MVLVLLIVLAIVLILGGQFATKKQGEHNADLLRIVLAVTGCTTEDTPERCAQRQEDRARAEGVERLLVVDCLVRRALANKPSPRPGEVCRP